MPPVVRDLVGPVFGFEEFKFSSDRTPDAFMCHRVMAAVQGDHALCMEFEAAGEVSLHTIAMNDASAARFGCARE